MAIEEEHKIDPAPPAKHGEHEQEGAGGQPDPQGKGGFLADLKKAPAWVWIALALAAGTLIIGVLSYKKQSGSGDPTSTSATDPNANPTSGQDATGGYSMGGAVDPGMYSQGMGSDNSSIMTAIAQIQSEIQQLISGTSSQPVPTPPPVPGGHNHHHKGGSGDGNGGHLPNVDPPPKHPPIPVDIPPTHGGHQTMPPSYQRA